jgi:hypothetical protein
VAPKLGFEVDTALREAEVTGLSSSVNLVYELPSLGRVTPYVAGGVGVSSTARSISSHWARSGEEDNLHRQCRWRRQDADR